MDNLKFKTSANHLGFITNISVGGLLVIENAQKIKDEFIGILNKMSDSIEMEINEVEHIDVSFIQLIISFASQLNANGIKFRFSWNLDDDQRILIESVGLSNELYMNE